MSKRRVYISDHGTFNLFNMDISLPAIIELTEEQIEYINNTGLYQISELSAAQASQALPTLFSGVDGDRFDSARTISVNELSFKTPIMGTQFAKKAKDAIIVKRNSIYAKAAMAQQELPKKNTVSEVKVESPIVEKPLTEDITENNTKKKKNNSEESK